MTAPRPKTVVLCILDGWGHRRETKDNAIAQAATPTWDRMLATCPNSLIETSGDDVGLPSGQMGNSEVGHMNIGAGRVVMQDLPRINAAVKRGEIGTLPAFAAFMDTVNAAGGDIHLMGLISPGGVHCHQAHMAALAKAAVKRGAAVKVHAFMDGRDAAPKSGEGFVEGFLKDVGDLETLSIATVCGRYYAMDRDKRWGRVRKAYDAMVSAQGDAAPNALAAIEASYAAGFSDEFIPPTVIGDYAGMRDGDAALVANFRADRARQITQAILDDAFDGFQRSKTVALSGALSLTEYSPAHRRWLTPLFPPQTHRNTLGEVVSKAGLSQLRIAETEKYAHVTFFLNGGEETVYPGEKRILAPSPDVATYDLKPEMSAPEITDHVVKAIENRAFDLIVVNYANGDMVGHTGVMAAAMKAVETIDASLARLETALQRAGGVMLATADHGNVELMKDPHTGEPCTQHTVGKVRAILVNGPKGATLCNGRLADLAPTTLALIGLPQPGEMTGRSLLGAVEGKARASAAQ